jgi:hypothetical protein
MNPEPETTMIAVRPRTVLGRQSGVSLLGILVILALFSFFLTVAIRLFPAYMEGRAVKSAIESVAEASSPENSIRDVVRRLDSTFNTNRIESISARDVKVYREDGKIYIDASYEARTPLFQNVDAVLKFNDYKVVIE